MMCTKMLRIMFDFKIHPEFYVLEKLILKSTKVVGATAAMRAQVGNINNERIKLFLVKIF